MNMELILITNDIRLGKYAEDSGVDRIMIDLEILGKKERQGHLNTVISKHTMDDVRAMRKVLITSKLLVRINPIHEESQEEIQKVLDEGADIIMLPMFKTKEDVQLFVNLVNARATTCLLLETAEALARIDSILTVQGIDEIHIGLNDLHLSMNLTFMFELLSDGIVEYLSQKIRGKGIVFGFGGMARIGQGMLDSSLILSEHYRLNSERVILSRDFKGGVESFNDLIEIIDLKKEIHKIQKHLKHLSKASPQELLNNKKELDKKVALIIKSRV